MGILIGVSVGTQGYSVHVSEVKVPSAIEPSYRANGCEVKQKLQKVKKKIDRKLAIRRFSDCERAVAVLSPKWTLPGKQAQSISWPSGDGGFGARPDRRG